MSPNGILRVDPTVLKSSGRAFGKVASDLAGLHPETALADAAAGASQLKTGAACASAETTVSTQMTALADAAKQYGQNLTTAAERYRNVDAAGAESIGSVQIPK